MMGTPGTEKGIDYRYNLSVFIYYPPPPIGEAGYSDEHVLYVCPHLCVNMCESNTFTVYTITSKILEQSAPIFLWALSVLLASVSLHLGSVAVLG